MSEFGSCCCELSENVCDFLSIQFSLLVLLEFFEYFKVFSNNERLFINKLIIENILLFIH